MKFTSVLTGQHSPKNGCFGNDGEELCLLPIGNKAEREGGHPFTGTFSKEKNQYGWVKKVEPFTIEEFLERKSLPKAQEVHDLQSLMFKAISKLSENDPVAADYFPRGLPPKPALVVHKVIFHE